MSRKRNTRSVRRTTEAIDATVEARRAKRCELDAVSSRVDKTSGDHWVYIPAADGRVAHVRRPH